MHTWYRTITISIWKWPAVSKKRLTGKCRWQPWRLCWTLEPVLASKPPWMRWTLSHRHLACSLTCINHQPPSFKQKLWASDFADNRLIHGLQGLMVYRTWISTQATRYSQIRNQSAHRSWSKERFPGSFHKNIQDPKGRDYATNNEWEIKGKPQFRVH